MKRKLFAIVLAVIMVVSILPVGVFAASVTVSNADELKAAVGTNNEITLTADIALESRLTISKEITLNLNGYKITGDFDDGYGTIYVGTEGILYVIDETGNGGIYSTETYAIGNFGQVTLKGGHYVSDEDDAALYNFYYDSNTYGKAVINGNAELNTIWNCGILEVNNGKIDLLDNSGKLTINNGSVEEMYLRDGTDCPEVDGKGTVTIKNGVFGTFDAEENVEFAISGGSYDEEVDDDYIVDGYKCFKFGVRYFVALDRNIIITFDANGGKVVGKDTLIRQFGDAYGELPTATKRGCDFIGWVLSNSSTTYVNANSSVHNPPSGKITLVAVYDANELGDTNNFPRLYPLTVIAGEGGTVEGFSGKKDLIIAFGAGRKIEIVPEEGYEIKDVIINGKYHLGAVEEYKIVSAHMAYSVEAVFAPVPVYTPVYTENFDGEATAWVSGGTTEAAVLANGTLTVKSTGGDPNINCPEAFGLACDTIDVIRVKYTNNTENTAFQIFFTNEANPGYSEAGSFKATCVAGANEIVIDTSVNELWTGTLSNMRIDLSNGTGEFIVDSISFETVSYNK